MSLLTRSVEGGPGLLVDPGCPMIRKGFNGGYHFNRIQVTGVEAKYRDVPNKNQYSHPHDALQYAALVADREVAGATAQLGAARPAMSVWRDASCSLDPESPPVRRTLYCPPLGPPLIPPTAPLAPSCALRYDPIVARNVVDPLARKV